ncbi:MAG: O-antigen ligase family protein [candidate division KSB1 bacterium]|nr:O-antigen ligase family protein [candidate division KSB1 bacterium]
MADWALGDRELRWAVGGAFLAALAGSMALVSLYEWVGLAGVVIGPTLVLLLWYLPEFWVALLFSSGIFKEWATLALPIFRTLDFTLVLALLALVAYLLRWLRQPRGMPVSQWASLLTFAVFAGYLLLSVSWSPSPAYGLSKALSFAGFGGVLFLAASGMAGRESVVRSLWVLFFMALGTSIYTVATLSRALGNLPKIYEFYRASFLGVNPISYAQWLGTIAVASFALGPGLRSRGARLLAYAGSLLMTAVVLAANSRGPTLSLLICLLALAFLESRRRHSLRPLRWLALGVVVVVSLVSLLPEKLVSRYSDFSTERSWVSQIQSRLTMYQRLRAWERAFDVTTEDMATATLGLGSGGFSHEYYHEDVPWWPHNIFLEVLCEGGAIGLLLLLGHWATLLVGVSAARSKAAHRDASLGRIYLAVGLGILFLFVGAQFSGDLSHNRRLWYFLGLLCAVNSDAADSK